jgi:hypothetical protein
LEACAISGQGYHSIKWVIHSRLTIVTITLLSLLQQELSFSCVAIMMFLFIFWLLLGLSRATTDVASCSCGFLDPKTGSVWTDAIVIYANETDQLPGDSFIAESYQHKSEKNWNARYRAGASPANVGHNESTGPGWNGSAWTFELNPPSPEHFVVGSSVRSLRHDIQFGSFETALSPATTDGKAGGGGSVLAMRLDYNASQTLQINVMNADDPNDAWTNFMMYGDWRGDRNKGVNFSDFGNNTYKFPSSPWGLVPYRLEWTDKNADFFIGDALARSVSARSANLRWPSTPSALYFTHSSIGDLYTSQGPPPNGSVARVGMIRAFFNSSVMSEAKRVDFNTRCRKGAGASTSAGQCLLSDISLRGSTPFTHAATVNYKQPAIDYTKRWPAIFIASICITISTVLLVHATIKRAPWRSKTPAIAPAEEPVATSTTYNSRRTSQTYSITHSMVFSADQGLTGAAQFPGTGTPGAVTPGNVTPGRTSTPRASMLHPFSRSSDVMSASSDDATLKGNGSYFSRPVSPWVATPGSSQQPSPLPVGITILHAENNGCAIESALPRTVVTTMDEKKAVKVEVKAVTDGSVPIAGAQAPISAPKARVDYLAGLVALASILVTLIHFCLTFLPATAIPYTHTHYKSELWALKIVAPYLLTFSWIGPFFTSSTRFLVMTFLKTGNLKGVAEKTVGRTPRLIIPCAAIAALEYFCMQVGATNYLEFLPSVTWSTWPYTSNYVNFGHYISEVIELMYIIPNAVPQITFNYCIGVLWTIPVQLQNSWTSLLAVIVLREIKTPWKRMCYYAFCIIQHWYAMSWGSFFWVGLLIADLDITYKWKTWLNARPFVYYPFIFILTLLALGSPSLDLVSQWTTVNFSTLEYGIHPQRHSGHRIRETSDYGYPPYYIPRLSALTFSIGFHLLVELSPLVQMFFSNRLFMWLFPHILTLYLIHGLVFWSLGAVICVKLASLGVPYWANMLVVATCCYTVIFGCLPILTPVIETLGKSVTMNIWRDASEKPARRRKSLFPFSADMFMDGEKNDTQAEPKSNDVEKNDRDSIGQAL